MNRHLAIRLSAWGLAAVTVVGVGVVAAQPAPTRVRPGHVAGIECGEDGDVHASAGSYGAAQYVLDGGTPVPFTGGFTLTLSGATAHTLTVTADDWATYDGSAGPCIDEGPPTTVADEQTTTTAADESTTTGVEDEATTTTTAGDEQTTTTGATVPGATTTTAAPAPDASATTVAATTTTTAAPVNEDTSPATTAPPTTAPPTTAATTVPAPGDGLPETR